MCDNACEIHAKKGQTMTSIVIENVSFEFLPKFKALAKTAKAEFKVLEKDIKSAKPKKTAKSKVNSQKK